MLFHSKKMLFRSMLIEFEVCAASWPRTAAPAQPLRMFPSIRLLCLDGARTAAAPAINNEK